MDIPERYSWITSRLRRLSGRNPWYACCPAHDDQKPSLIVRIDKDRLFLTCKLGCSIHEINSALGITMSDLYPAQARVKQTIEKVYKYIDEDGFLLYQNVRFIPKEFRFRSPVAKNVSADYEGPWEWTISGRKRILYRTPELVKHKGDVLFVEGEKDVDNLKAIGIVATTTPMGARSFRYCKEYACRILAGHRVFVVADDDPWDDRISCYPGLRYATDVCRSLQEAGIECRIGKFFNDRKKKDSTDFIQSVNFNKAEVLKALDGFLVFDGKSDYTSRYGVFGEDRHRSEVCKIVSNESYLEFFDGLEDPFAYLSSLVELAAVQSGKRRSETFSEISALTELLSSRGDDV